MRTAIETNVLGRRKKNQRKWNAQLSSNIYFQSARTSHKKYSRREREKKNYITKYVNSLMNNDHLLSRVYTKQYREEKREEKKKNSTH